MAHILSSVVSKISTAPTGDHQPGVSQPESPVDARDEDIELSLPPTAASNGKARAMDFSTAMPDPQPSSGFPALGPQYSHASAAPITPGSEEADPLLLRSRLVGETDLRRRPTKAGLRAKRNVVSFYEAQNSHIENLLKPLHEHSRDDEEAREDNALKVKFAIYGSFAANCILAILQLYAAVSSLSLSLFATAADSVFDPFANLALLLLHRKSSRVDERKWPAGGSRFENVGNCVYAFLMGAVSIILVVESIRDLATGAGEDKKLHVPSLVAVGVAFGVKFALFLYCFALKRFSSQIEVLMVDHRNDLFINGLGIITSALGAKIAWWIDPAGAMLISCIIIVVWSLTAAENFRQLAGHGAPPEFLQLITYHVMLYHETISKVDSVRAYHFGPQYVVEIDVVMDEDTPLKNAHDIAQSLQDVLEDLPDVSRCFVHIDYEVDHAPEHRKKV